MEVIQSVLDWYMANMNYLTIFTLMAIESSFIPFPSEVVIPFAAYKAAQGALSITGVVLAGTAGALFGALFNYYFALYLGRPVIYRLAETKWAHWLLIDREKVEHAEEYFVKHGKISTFIGRLIPAIRQLISLPAGLSKMKIGSFIFYTVLGAGIWNIILAVVGYFAYDMREKIFPYLDLVMIVLGIVFIAWLSAQGYSAWKRKKARRNQ